MILQLRNLRLAYGTHPLLDDAEISIDRGERVADVARGEPLRDELVVRASEFLAG